MEIKFERSLRLNEEQLKEVLDLAFAPSLTEKPMSFDSVAEKDYWKKTKVWMTEIDGDHGTYTLRINLSWELITVLEVK
jgi:hypothetical protein